MACTFGSNLRELGQVGGRRKRKEAVRPQRQVSRGRGGSPRLHAGGSPESPGRYSLAHSYVDAIPFGYGEEVGLSPALAAAQPQAGLAGLSPASRQHRHARLAAVRRQRENHQTQRLPQSPVARPPHSVPQPTPPALRQGSPGTPRPSPRFQARASPHPRFTNLPSSPLRDPSFEMAERMKAWKPELPFPFDVDLEEYDPIGVWFCREWHGMVVRCVLCFSIRAPTLHPPHPRHSRSSSSTSRSNVARRRTNATLMKWSAAGGPLTGAGMPFVESKRPVFRKRNYWCDRGSGSDQQVQPLSLRSQTVSLTPFPFSIFLRHCGSQVQNVTDT